MDKYQEKGNNYHFNLYRRLPVTIVRGAGTKVWDIDGKEYTDFLAGIAVNSVGHCHPKVVKAIQNQAGQLIHITNIYYNQPQANLSELLVNISDFDRLFLCNSGLEANEAAIKLARKYGNLKHKKGPIISFSGAFHGRSIASITMGGDKLQKGFAPLPVGFKRIPFNNVSALKENLNSDTVAVFVESIQGEGGIIEAELQFMENLQELCKRYEILLVIDEIQTGFGRTGKLFGYKHYPIEPDMITIAKAMGGGMPIGGILAKEEVSELFSPGDHGTTFGGNPLACAASYQAISVIINEGLIDRAQLMGDYMKKALESLLHIDAVLDIRGNGLMLGVQVNFPCRPVLLHMLEKGFLINCTQEYTIRLVPPLTISKKEIDDLVEHLEMAIQKETKIFYNSHD